LGLSAKKRGLGRKVAMGKGKKKQVQKQRKTPELLE